jgi:hypothetical protein
MLQAGFADNKGIKVHVWCLVKLDLCRVKRLINSVLMFITLEIYIVIENLLISAHSLN